MTWETSTRKVTCKCGRVYEETQRNLPLRDKDSYICACGHELKRWNGSAMYSYAEISGPTHS